MIDAPQTSRHLPPGARGVRLADAPTVSVVVTSCRERQALEACLDPLLRECSEVGAEVVVVRAAAADQLKELTAAYPTVRFVAAPRDATIPELRAAGMAEAEGDIVALREDHGIVPPDWLTGLANASAGTRVLDGAATPRRTAPLGPGDRVVIIGAGPAGLTAGYLLARDAVPVTVLEADNVVGGIARTAQYKGYRFDIGGHRFFTKIPPVETLWNEILGSEFVTVPRLSRIHYNGRFFDYPLRASNALRGLGLWNTILIVLSYLRAKLRPEPVEDTFEQWVTNRFGKRLYQIFFKTYTEKVWGIPCTEIRSEWAAQRIQGLSLAAAILSAAPLQKRSTAIKSLINEFRYPRLGPGQMWETCRARVEDWGGQVLLEHPVRAIEVDGDRVVAVRVATPDGERRFEGEHFITTMPLRSLVRALDPPAPDAVAAAAEGLRYRDFILVALILDQPNPFPDNWIYVHTPGVKVGRVQNFRNWSPAMVPDPAKTCLGMEYFCFKGDELWTSSDADLIALATRELHVLGLTGSARVVDGTVVRMPKAYPIYDGTYRGHLERIREYLDQFGNLHPVGRNGMHKYNNQDHSMLTAMMAVWNMGGATHDTWAVNTDFDYHEEMRVPAPSASIPAATAPG